MPTGAQNALAGYLYQFVGAAGLAARAQISASTRPHRFKRLFSWLEGSTVAHELADMDAAVLLLNPGDAVGIQYKYSSSIPPEEIDAQDLIEMLDVFHRSAAITPNIRYLEYALITNRSLSNAARMLYQTRGGATPDPSLFPHSGKRGKLSKLGKKAIGYYGGANIAASARNEILSKLELNLGVAHEDWIRQIREYASLHGVLPSEFDKALTDLIGLILHRTIGDTLELSAELLNGSLLGVPDARALGPSGSTGGAREAAAGFCSNYIAHTLTDDLDTLIRRRFLDELEKQVQLHPLVFVVGEGGSGKSVLAAQYLRETSRDRFVAAIVASDVNGDWPGLAFNTWRSPGYSGDLAIESVDRMLGRLRQADRETPRPILILDVDGLDEIGLEHRHTTKRLIGEFFRRGHYGSADAVLLATCRSNGRVSDGVFRSLIGQWLSTDIPNRHVDSVGWVIVGDFDREELLEAAKMLGEVYRTRIAQSLYSLFPSESSDLLYVGDEGISAETRPSDRPEFIRSFLHPAMWRAFIELGEDERIRVLDQEPVALRELASRFLGRFCSKVERRRPSLSEARAFRALRVICAVLPPDLSMLDRQVHWIVAARGPIGDDEAAQLFDEAISYGLIVEEERGHWSWRHGIVYDHLRGA